MAYPPPPYKDATCGLPVCGEAVCGTFWVYPARGTLSLNGRAVILGGYSGLQVSVNRGVLSLQGRVADPRTEIFVLVGRGALSLSGRQTVLHYSSTFAPQRGQLRLVGSNVDFVGQEFLFPLVCSDVSLSTASCNGETLAPAPVQELAMASLDCR